MKTNVKNILNSIQFTLFFNKWLWRATLSLCSKERSAVFQKNAVLFSIKEMCESVMSECLIMYLVYFYVFFSQNNCYPNVDEIVIMFAC